MKTRYAPNIRNAVIGTLVAGGLVAGFLVFGPGAGGPPPASGPAARAMLAVGAGAPASPDDLSALVVDRERWLRARPADEASWAVLGSAYVELGTLVGEWSYYPRAETALKRSLEELPAAKGNADAQLGMAALANARRDYATAKRWGEKVRARTPKRWTAYPVLIDAYNGLGDYKAAGKAAERLQALRPGAAPTLARAAQMYAGRGRSEDAAATAHEAMTRARTAAERAAARFRLGELAWGRGEPAEAVGHYDTALRTDAGHHPSLAGRARALAALGRKDEAMRDYTAALEKRPLPEYALEAGELYESLGLDGDARTQYQVVPTRAAKAQGQGVNVELVLGRYEADHGDAHSAVRRLTMEWERGHRSLEVADALGWALYRAGRAGEGLTYAKRATEPNMRNPLFSYHRGEIERARGLDGPARRHLAEALRINPYFSPLLAPRARAALEKLGEPAAGGPEDVWGEAEPLELTRVEPESDAEPESESESGSGGRGRAGEDEEPTTGPSESATSESDRSRSSGSESDRSRSGLPGSDSDSSSSSSDSGRSEPSPSVPRPSDQTPSDQGPSDQTPSDQTPSGE
ncbi:tetratricopeptide repeat protein [Streptomyces sp. NPDC002133]|uniref:tetratricopeptide repeat protein n=1 Tax=Streptomyces sp. NPDC002133 TaxID=3154409 RepID=UPI00332C8FF0